MANVSQLQRNIEIALGKRKADLVLKNATVVDLFCHTTHVCDVAIADGIIVGLGQYDGNLLVDCTGKFVMPSFFDTHLHFESSLATPDRYLSVAVPHGVTTVNADCHEIANVCGETGVQYMMDCVKNIPVNVRFMLSSCVPSTPFDHANAEFTAADTERMMAEGKYCGLAEMMNYPAVLAGDTEVLRKIACAAHTDGHAPALSGKQLNAYLAAGILTDHECNTVPEVLEKVGKGMYVQIREGSQTKNLTTLIGAVNNATKRRLLFCSDDRNIGDVRATGTIQNCVVTAVEKGVDIFDALTIASLNAYECYGIPRCGAIAIGYRADLLVTDDLVPRKILQVYCNGKKVAENGKALFGLSSADASLVTDTVRIAPLNEKDFIPKFTAGQTPVMEVFPNTIVTARTYCSSTKGLNLCAVIERHKASGNVGCCYVKGFDLKGGAIAQTVGHDAHNITVVGDNPHDMLLAVDALGKNGGMAIVAKGKVEYVFELPIAGLMSAKEPDEIIAEHETLFEKTKACLQMNPDISPYMLLSFLSLVVVPELKLTDSGLFDVTNFRFID